MECLVLIKISSASSDYRHSVEYASYSCPIHGAEGGQDMAGFAESGRGREAAVAGQEYRDLPLVAREILDVLQDDLADPELYRRYVGQYLAIWPSRYGRLMSALQTENKEALMDAVLSIKTSAGMLGALRLAQLASDLEDELRRQRMDEVRALAAEVERCGELTTEQLRHELPDRP